MYNYDFFMHLTQIGQDVALFFSNVWSTLSAPLTTVIGNNAFGALLGVVLGVFGLNPASVTLLGFVLGLGAIVIIIVHIVKLFLPGS